MRKSALKGVLEFRGEPAYFTRDYYVNTANEIDPSMYKVLKTLPFMLLLVLGQSVRIRKVCITLSGFFFQILDVRYKVAS